jgi:hypothetical protein
MNSMDLISSLAAEWEPDTGFLWKARQGEFDAGGFERTLAKLRAETIDENAEIPRRLVSLLWYIPLFLSWQVDRLREANGDVKSYLRAVAAITNEVERLLGTP